MDVSDRLRSLGLGQVEAAFRGGGVDADVQPELNGATWESLVCRSGSRRLVIFDADRRPGGGNVINVRRVIACLRIVSWPIDCAKCVQCPRRAIPRSLPQGGRLPRSGGTRERLGGDTCSSRRSVKFSKVLRGARRPGCASHAIACGEVKRLDEAGGRVRRVARVGQSRNSEWPVNPRVPTLHPHRR